MKRTAIQFSQSIAMCNFLASLDNGIELRSERSAIALEIEFKIQSKTSRIPLIVRKKHYFNFPRARFTQLEMNYLKRIIERSDTTMGFAFDIFVQTLVVLSVIAYSIETLPGISPSLASTLNAFEVFTVAVFSIEYGLRLLVAKSKSQYAFSFFGVIDLIAILPFYLSMGFDPRALRAFRLLRIVRLLKLARYNSAIRRFHIALLLTTALAK